MSSSTFRLQGLEPDNLLAILALIGTLRLLDEERPTWNTRVSWSGTPWRPELVVTANIDVNELTDAIAVGADRLGAEYTFHGEQDIKFSRAAARRYLAEARVPKGAGKEQLWSALVSDGAVKPDGDTVVAPALCTMLGQGHQHFLERLARVACGATSKVQEKGKASPSLSDPVYLSRALFEPWKRSDATDAFRWDPAEDRRYALRDGDPSKDPGTTEHGANRLAVLALPLLSSFPTGLRGAAAIATVGFSRDADRRVRCTWPIWTKPWDCPMLIDALASPELQRDVPRLRRLSSRGIVAAYRSYRLEVGYYANFSVAQVLLDEGTGSDNRTTDVEFDG